MNIQSGTVSQAPFLQDLMSVIAHDVNNYVSCLRLGMSNIRNKSEILSRDEVVVQIDRLSDTVEKVADLVARLLEARRLQSGLMPHHLNWASINTIVKDCIQHFQLQAETKGILLVCHVVTPDILIYTDVQLLTEVLANLVSNAIKFSQSTSMVTLHVMGNNDWVYFGVEDEGQGLTEDDLTKIFKEYSPLSAKPTQGETSLGLGLFIVSGIVNLLGGHVWAESRGKGHGAVFNVTIPRLQKHHDLV